MTGEQKKLIAGNASLVLGACILLFMLSQSVLYEVRYRAGQRENQDCIKRIERSNIPFMVVDHKGQVLSLSRGAESALGIEKSDAVGRELVKVMDDLDAWTCLGGKEWSSPGDE